jgi:hypothetical protein
MNHSDAPAKQTVSVSVRAFRLADGNPPHL